MSSLQLQEAPQMDAFRSVFTDPGDRITCPECGRCDFSTCDSEPLKNGIKVRYRECESCGFKLKTAEFIVEGLYAKHLAEIRRFIATLALGGFSGTR